MQEDANEEDGYASSSFGHTFLLLILVKLCVLLKLLFALNQQMEIQVFPLQCCSLCHSLRVGEVRQW